MQLIRPNHRRQDDICDDSDSPLHSSSRPEDGGDLLLNLVKEALVKYGLAVNATGPSTFIVKGTGGTPSFILAQNGSVIHIRKD